MIRVINHAKVATINALRLVCLCAGAWLAGVVPVAYLAEVRSDMNAAMGHLPNMDPGTGISIAVMLIIPVLVALLVIELFRAWVWGKTPLALFSFFTLGIAAAWPIGLSFGSRLLGSQYGVNVLLTCPLSVAAFYLIHHWWISRHSKNQVSVPH